MTFKWGERTYVMGILNVTPDSFSGDGLLASGEDIADRARQMVEDGADILDIGGESTRPGHTGVEAEEELRRVIPAIEAVAGAVSVPISVDTSKAAVARAALAAGATIVNDIRGFTADPDLAQVAADAGCPVILMHDLIIESEDRLIADIVYELSLRVERALQAGVARDNIIIDPGFGFGKFGEMNLTLLRRMGELRALGLPILAGTSRKSTIGMVLGTDPDDRLEGTAATVVLAIANGADIVRVHDVKEMARVVKMTDAVVRG